MAAPCETFKLPRGMGRLCRYTNNGQWSWQRWDPQSNKWVVTPTGKKNRGQAEQLVYQKAASRAHETCRLEGVPLLFQTVADEYVEARTLGQACKRLRPRSLLKLSGALRRFGEFIGRRYESLLINQVDDETLTRFVETERKRVIVDVANSHLSFISQVLIFAVQRKYISKAPQATPLIQNQDLDDDDAIAGWPWSPNQLRHNAATMLRKYFGIEAARVVLGHTSAAVTEIYAEVDERKAAEIMGQVG